MNNSNLPVQLKKAVYYRKKWNPKLYENTFINWKGMKDKNSFRIYIPYNDTKQKQISIPNSIRDAIQSKGYEIQDYIAGIAKQNDDKRIMKIGRLLSDRLQKIFTNDEMRDYIAGIDKQKDDKRIMKIGRLLSDRPELQKIFNNDPQRALSKTSDKLVVISRHPYDIAGQSTGRGWTSCTNLIGGENKKYVLCDIKEGTLIAYLINSDDKNIKNPISRVLIKPFINKDNKKDIALASEDKQYGTPDKQFKDIVDNWINEINGPDKIGMYCKNPKLYNDGKKDLYFRLSTKEQTQIEAVKQQGYAAIQYIKKPSEIVQLTAVRQYGTAIQYIKKPSEKTQTEAVKQQGYAIQYIKNPSENVQLVAVRQSGYFIKYIKNPSEKVQLAAVRKDATAILYIKNPSENVQMFIKSIETLSNIINT